MYVSSLTLNNLMTTALINSPFTLHKCMIGGKLSYCFFFCTIELPYGWERRVDEANLIYYVE